MRMESTSWSHDRGAHRCKSVHDSPLLLQVWQATIDIDSVLLYSRQSMLASIPGSTNAEKLQNAWVGLQTHVNNVVDSNLDKFSRDKQPGIKQVRQERSPPLPLHI